MNVVPLTPITSVKVLRNVPLDNTYKDTLKFTSVSNQISYFTGKAKQTFTGLTPVKLQNKLRLPVTADYLYDCNYIMFQNGNFGQKWFYAFINKIDFINVNMCEVEIEIDVYQTWQFDITVKPSYVEREHASSDNIGDNLVTENVDLGYYREEPAETTNLFNSYVAVIATSWDGSGKTGGYRGGLFTGLSYIPALVDNDEQVQSLVKLLDDITTANKSDAITSIFMMPSMFFTNDATPVLKRFDASKQVSKIGSYTPKNKKLLTYPYNFLYVFTPDGANNIYKYEYFQNPDSCGFNIQCAMSCNPEIILEPIAYQKQQFNIDESLSMGNFPQCAYSIDSFKAWLAQNSAGTLISMAGTAMGIATGNPIASTMGVLGMASTVNGVVQASMKPPQVRGGQGNSTFTGTREKNFYFINKHVSEEYAKIIDDYFSMFGYATNRVKVPNMNNRESWNYVKTTDCKIVGSVPFGDMTRIKEMFNSGVTFWHGDFVGDYGRSNNIV